MNIYYKKAKGEEIFQRCVTCLDLGCLMGCSATVPRVRDLVLKIDGFCITMMNFVIRMMDFVLTMMNFAPKRRAVRGRLIQRATES